MPRTAPRAAVLVVLAWAASCTAGGPEAKPAPEPPCRLLVPAYFYPADDGLKHWDRLLAASARVPVLAIINPASGPGTKADPNYTQVLERAKKRPGLTLLGYVSTSYGKRPSGEVKADVDRWLRLYPQVQGVFLDEQASAADLVDYYADLYAHARRTKALRLVVTNPGTVCAEAYLAKPAADVACLFEGPRGFGGLRPPDWAARYAPRRLAALAYGVGGAEKMRECLREALGKGAGCVYVTDGTGANPWDRLPAYWDDEVSAAEQLNRKKAR